MYFMEKTTKDLVMNLVENLEGKWVYMRNVNIDLFMMTS